jgi:hypothetical protein
MLELDQILRANELSISLVAGEGGGAGSRAGRGQGWLPSALTGDLPPVPTLCCRPTASRPRPARPRAPAVPSLLVGGFVVTRLYRLLFVPRQPDPKREAIPCRCAAPG